MTIMRVSKEDNRNLRWVTKATTTDEDRPILQGLNVSEDAVIGCDGYRLHAVAPMASIPEPTSGPVTLNFGKIAASASVLETELVEGNYPDFSQIVPSNTVAAEDCAVVSFNPKFLREALAGMEGIVELRIRAGHPIEILGDKNGDARYALIMPMHNDAKYRGALHASTWRPGDNVNDNSH